MGLGKWTAQSTGQLQVPSQALHMDWGLVSNRRTCPSQTARPTGRALPPAPTTLHPQCPGPQASPRTHPCSSILGAPGPTVPSARVGGKVPPNVEQGHARLLLLVTLSLLPCCPAARASQETHCWPTIASGRLSLKKGKNKKGKAFCITPHFHGLNCTPLATAMTGSRTAGI